MVLVSGEVAVVLLTSTNCLALSLPYFNTIDKLSVAEWVGIPVNNRAEECLPFMTTMSASWLVLATNRYEELPQLVRFCD